MNPLTVLKQKLQVLTWSQMITLGEKVDVSPWTMKNIVSGRNMPKYDTVVVLLKEFGQQVIVWPIEGSVLGSTNLEEMEGMAQ